MKFTTIVAVALFGITTHASALPASVQVRTFDPIGTIKADINILTVNVQGDLSSITQTISTATGSISGQLQVIAALNIDLSAIVSAIYKTTQQITSSTTNALVALNPIDFNTLIVTIEALIELIVNIGVTLKSGLSQLPPATVVAVTGEILAVEAALSGLLSPISTYVSAVESAVANTGVNVTGLQSTLQSLVSIITNLVLNIGVSSSGS